MLLTRELPVSWTTTTRAGRPPEHRLTATTPDGTKYQSAGYSERSARLEWLFRDAIRKHQTGGRVTVFAIAAKHYAIPASL